MKLQELKQLIPVLNCYRGYTLHGSIREYKINHTEFNSKCTCLYNRTNTALGTTIVMHIDYDQPNDEYIQPQSIRLIFLDMNLEFIVDSEDPLILDIFFSCNIGSYYFTYLQ